MPRKKKPKRGRPAESYSQERRLISILLRLTFSKRPWTRQELSLLERVTTRTIDRDLTALRSMGIPLVSEIVEEAGIQLKEWWVDPAMLKKRWKRIVGRR